MPAQIGRFSRVALIRVARRSWLLGRLRRSAFRHRPPKADLGPITPQSSTVVAQHERESWMARRKLTVDRHEEIKRRLADGRSLREIASALGCSRRLVRQIRDGERLTHETAASPDPLVDGAARMAGHHPRARPRPPDEIYLGGAGEGADHVPELLETVLPQVPAVPGGDRHGPRVRARRTGGSRLRRRSDRVVRDQDRRDPQSLCVRLGAWL